METLFIIIITYFLRSVFETCRNKKSFICKNYDLHVKTYSLQFYLEYQIHFDIYFQ